MFEEKFIFFRNPSHTQIVTFSLGQKKCQYLGNCHYNEGQHDMHHVKFRNYDDF